MPSINSMFCISLRWGMTCLCFVSLDHRDYANDVPLFCLGRSPLLCQLKSVCSHCTRTKSPRPAGFTNELRTSLFLHVQCTGWPHQCHSETRIVNEKYMLRGTFLCCILHYGPMLSVFPMLLTTTQAVERGYSETSCLLH